MEKIKINGIKKEIYHEKLNNGLDIYMVNSKSKNFYISFTTKFGSGCIEYKDVKTNRKVQIKKGVAHFLEHQMFEEKDGNAFVNLASLGAIANAYTSLDNTTYLVLGDKNFKECLNVVLDFVQSPYFIPKNVDIERKIIEEEIKLNNDNYGLLMDSTLSRNLFKKDPQKNLITGDEEDIKEIKVTDLEKAYKTFYNPENMFICITGNFYPLEALGIIKENQKNKKFLPAKNVNIIKYKEPVNVCKKYEVINKDINIPLITIGYKLSKTSFKDIKEKDLNNLIDAFMFLTFGKSSDLNNTLIDENLINEDIDYYYIVTSNIIVLTVTVSSNYVSEVSKQIDEALIKQKFNDEKLERYKRVKISEYISNFNDIVSTNDLMVNDLINGKINTNVIANIKSLSVKNLNKFASFIKNDNKSTVVVEKIK